mmetsp:Transcript_16290/g.35664  ORF Transcript_16290/g.35664 Transcript_16290/m.35664 type:complete len:824 (+) Transcript_16290:51-2522(+)
MDYTVQQLDEMCSRIDRLAEQIASPTSGGAARDEQVISESVQIIQRIGEGIAWAYGQSNKPGLGEQFAQPFVDRRLTHCLKALITDKRPLRREMQTRVAAQVLQTIHILLQATPSDSLLFCNLTAGWYLNEVVSVEFDFLENEDLLPLWMTVVKDIAMMLNKDNLMLFFDPGAEKPFPIFSEAIRFYHHPVSQVRTHVQATSLEIFLKLRSEDVWAEPLFEVVLADSAVFFTHVSCLLREFWRMVDDAARSQARRDVRNALYIQNDILVYINDVFECQIPQLSAILQEKLLRFAVLPVLVRSMLRPFGAPVVAGEKASDILHPSTACYLLHDALTTLKSTSVFKAIALTLLRSQVPEDVLHSVTDNPLRSPSLYLAIQRAWSGHSASGAFESAEAYPPDETLYAMPLYPLVELLEMRDPRPVQPNKLFDALEGMLQNLTGVNEATSGAALLGVITLLLRTLRASQEALADGTAHRLGTALLGLLQHHRQHRWETLEATLGAVRELAAAVDVPVGRAAQILGRPLRESVLVPLAADLLQITKQASGAGQEAWLREYQEQWAAFQASTMEPSAAACQRDFLEQGSATAAKTAAPDGRARLLRILLAARRLAMGFLATDQGRIDEMPGIDEAELEEAAHYQPGVPVHIGKINRVKCQVRGSARGSEPESLYMLPAKATVVLVRPDDTKPFWAVPVIVEPLREAKLTVGADFKAPLEQISTPGTNGDEVQKTLRLEVAAPRSAFLKDRTSGTTPPSSRNLDRMAMSTPLGPLGAEAVAEQIALTLHFSDERRRRVACKILAQGQHSVQQHMAKGLEQLFADLRDDRL